MITINDYRVTQIHILGIRPTCRHIYFESKECLCKYKTKDHPFYTLEDYSLDNIRGFRGVPICKSCLELLPTKIKKEVILNLIITKLKK